MKEEIKYTYLKRKTIRNIFLICGILGGFLWSFFSYLETNPVNQGISNFGLILISGAIAFVIGVLIKVKD